MLMQRQHSMSMVRQRLMSSTITLPL